MLFRSVRLPWNLNSFRIQNPENFTNPTTESVWEWGYGWGWQWWVRTWGCKETRCMSWQWCIYQRLDQCSFESNRVKWDKLMDSFTKTIHSYYMKKDWWYTYVVCSWIESQKNYFRSITRDIWFFSDKWNRTGRPRSRLWFIRHFLAMYV